MVRGDTLSEIAIKYTIDADDIVRVNRLSNAASLRIGMDLVIPGAVRKVPAAVNIAKNKIEDKKIPIPTKAPTKAPVTVSQVTGLKSSYAVEYSGKSRGFV